MNFYPKYRAYYSLFNDSGSIRDIAQAEEEMLEVLNYELKYTALKQLFATAIAVSAGSLILNMLPLGFNNLMHGYFRTLCVAYGMYAIGNTIILVLLYFTDYKGALIASMVFAVTATAGTVITMFFSQVYYGFGFLAGAGVFLITALVRLNAFTGKLPYHILSRQSIAPEEYSGIFTRLEGFLDRKTAQGQACREEGLD